MSVDKLLTIRTELHILMNTLTDKACKIAKASSNTEETINKIMRMISRELSEKTTVYLSDIYTTLKSYTLEEDVFKDAAKTNAFYDLELGSKILQSYSFEVKDLDAYCKENGVKKIENIYCRVGASAGTMALGSILLAGLDKRWNVPFIVLVAGAVMVGLLSRLAYLGGKKYDKKKAGDVIKKYMVELESELIQWINGIEKYYDSEIEKLVKSFEE